jgi:tetratricopeptide (TPR) repeat protein
VRRALLALLILIGLIGATALSGRPNTALAQGTPVPPIFSPPPTPERYVPPPPLTAPGQTTPASGSTDQTDTLNNLLNVLQVIGALFVLIALILLIVGIFLLLEARSNATRAREMLGQVLEETKHMRVLQEAVKMRLLDLQDLRMDVTKDIDRIRDDMHNKLEAMLKMHADQVGTLQTEVSTKMGQMDSTRRDIEAAALILRSQFTDESRALMDRGELQVRNLFDVLNTRLKELESARRDVDTLSVTAQNQIRDQLQKIYERGDAQYKTLQESLTAHVEDYEALKEEITLTSREFRYQIDGELQVANASLSDLELLRAQVQEEIARMRSQVSESLQGAYTQLDRLGQGIANAQTQQTQQIGQALSMLQLAQSQLGAGHIRAALDTLYGAARLDPDNRVIQTAMADAYLQLGMPDEAMAALEQARAGQDDLPTSDAAYAYALVQKGDAEKDTAARERYYAQAQALLLVLMNQNPNLLDVTGESAYGGLASLYRKQGRMDQAVQYYEAARKVTPQNSYPLINLALLETMRNNADNARRYFTAVRDIAVQKVSNRRSDFWAWFDLVTAQVALGAAVEEIRRQTRAALDAAPNVRPLQKFLYGLEVLARSANPPALAEEVANTVRREIGKRQSA